MDLNISSAIKIQALWRGYKSRKGEITPCQCCLWPMTLTPPKLDPDYCYLQLIVSEKPCSWCQQGAAAYEMHICSYCSDRRCTGECEDEPYISCCVCGSNCADGDYPSWRFCSRSCMVEASRDR